jgi:signal transduction histidine kinase
VADAGTGFEAQEDKLFQPFARFHRSAEYPGTGMGLALCRRVVERHGGTIALESRPGSGTTVTIALPVAPASPT